MRLRVKDFTTKVGSGVTPKGGAESYLSQGIPLFRSQNVVDNGFLLDDIAYISEEVDESMKGSRVKAGDVLLNITGASIGRCYFTSDDFERGNVNQHVCIVRPKRTIISPEFLHYNIISNLGKEYIRQSQTGANREGLTIEDIKNFSFEIPSLSDQQRIVKYLNEKTKAIDARISVLEKKSDAYTRLKASVINRAVTRGLNPNVPLKDSGIEWIGMIPEHWKISMLKHYSSFHNGDRSSNYPSGIDLKESGVIFVTSNNIHNITLESDNVGSKYITHEKYNSLGGAKLQINDIVYCLRGSIGNCAINKSHNEGTVASSLVAIRARSLVADYLIYLLHSEAIRHQVNVTMNGSCAANLSAEVVSRYYIIIPPLSEQQSIASYLDTKCSEIDKAIDNLGKQIEALKRLKRSLINEVVTGKRKV